MSTIVVQLFNLPVNTIESTFGEIPNKLSLPSIPRINFETTQALIQSVFAIALLGGIESLPSGVDADAMTGGRHRSNFVMVMPERVDHTNQCPLE